MMLLLMAACSAVSSGVFMAHSSSGPSRAPAVVATVSGASVLIDAVTSANDREVLKERSVACPCCLLEAEQSRKRARGGRWRWRRGQWEEKKKIRRTDS